MKHFFIILILGTLSLAKVGEVTVTSGDAYIQRGVETIKASNSMSLFQTDIAKTKSGRLQMLFVDNTVISIGKNSLFKIQEYFYEENSQKQLAVFELKSGYAKAITGKIGKSGPQAFIMKTPSSTIVPHGTIWSVDIQKNNTEKFNVVEGSITISYNDGHKRLVTLGHGTSMTLYVDSKNPAKVLKAIKGKNVSQVKGNNRRSTVNKGHVDFPTLPNGKTLPNGMTLPNSGTLPNGRTLPNGMILPNK